MSDFFPMLHGAIITLVVAGIIAIAVCRKPRKGKGVSEDDRS